jgi:hypothetical protein
MGCSALALCFGSHLIHNFNINFVFMLYPHALIIIALCQIYKCKFTANLFLSILRKCNFDFPHVITLVIHICNSIPKVNPELSAPSATWSKIWICYAKSEFMRPKWSPMGRNGPTKPRVGTRPTKVLAIGGSATRPPCPPLVRALRPTNADEQTLKWCQFHEIGDH